MLTSFAIIVGVYSELRSAVYDCVQYLVHMTSSVGESSEPIKDIIRHIIEDIKPRVTTTKVYEISFVP